MGKNYRSGKEWMTKTKRAGRRVTSREIIYLGGVALDITEKFITVGGDDHISGFDHTSKALVSFVHILLELKNDTIDLVDHKNGLDTFSKSLTQDSLGLHANTFDAIDNDESTIGHTESSSNLRGEINVSGGINQVDKESASLGERDISGVEVGEFVEESNTSGFDGNTTFLFVRSRVGVTSLTGLLLGNNTSTTHERVGKSRLSVIDVSNNRHVTNVMLLVHDLTELID
jgi:hypothetical protein